MKRVLTFTFCQDAIQRRRRLRLQIKRNLTVLNVLKHTYLRRLKHTVKIIVFNRKYTDECFVVIPKPRGFDHAKSQNSRIRYGELFLLFISQVPFAEIL